MFSRKHINLKLNIMSDEITKDGVEEKNQQNQEQKLEVKTPATKESLEKVKYQDLKETFTVLGVPEAWKPGSTAAKMIANALEKLAVIKDLENKGLEGEELKEAADAKQAENDEKVKQMQAQEDEAKQEADNAEKADYRDQVKSMNLSELQAAKAIQTIDANLKNGVPSQRQILLNKRAVLKEMFDAGEFGCGCNKEEEE